MSVRRVLPLVCFFLVLAFPAFAAKRSVNGKIAFTSNRDGNLEIYVMNADGSGQTRLTNSPLKDEQPTWSPDGLRIAYVHDGDIHIMNADGSGDTLVGEGLAPAWSPDGLRIAFHSIRDADREAVSFEIYTMSPDGSNQTRITDRPGSSADAAWSPDGRSIAFTCQSELSIGKRQICVMNSDGSGIVALTDNANDRRDDDASFSPDGRKIVFTHDRFYFSGQDVTLMNRDGSDQTPLNVGLNGGLVVDGKDPVFSPDGTRIAYGGRPLPNGRSSIRTMDADGGNQLQITHNDRADDFDPAWQRRFPAETTGVYQPSTGKWFLRNSNTSGNADIIVKFGGQPGDLPVAGDWNGDGRTDVAVFRNGTFVRALLVPFCAACQGTTVADPLDEILFGKPGDLPVAGDWDGDGRDDLGVFRPGPLGTFLLRVPADLCPFCVVPHPSFLTKTFTLGTAGFLPVAGDWDGDGKDGVGLYDPATAAFFLSDSLAKPELNFILGRPGCLPLAGDWTGAAHDRAGVFDPFGPLMQLSTPLTGPPDIVFSFGFADGLPVAGHWTPFH